ncbi:MAG: nucleotidyltransferase family protein [Oscillospiraceae bacterium]|nr:nucleotidyltransferase family protein [Oscillospiraceae bacterium]
MKIVGILCEYNPMHLGHAKQISRIRELSGPETAVVCLMSGNFVQRGYPAIFDKSLRARAALLSGADLVLELPVQYALSSAEGFAAGAVSILGGFCHEMSFGAEHPDVENLTATARALLSPAFPEHLRRHLDAGLSFPAARAKALADMGADNSLLMSPNDILAVEYCKAMLSQNTPMVPAPIHRAGSYHDLQADPENPSATALRALIETGQDFRPYVPTDLFDKASVHTLALGERAVLARLRTMTDAEFEALPYGSEGLWRKFMHECRQKNTLEEILTAVKSKRYTRTRLDRMMMCAFLGLTAEDLRSPAPYARVLGFTKRGRQVLHIAKEHTTLYNVGQRVDSPQWAMEQRCSDLYGLFAENIEPAGMEPKRRVIIF